ncbi:hypothetical protein V5O48_010582 [Marasmius crinis-equi]|uniref:Altered inheritance of mitochondria protein 41 n=1 Tax=Marasmius crinis-equi TaxID=585013 RepID=A0ABR3F812_9AGAR
MSRRLAQLALTRTQAHNFAKPKTFSSKAEPSQTETSTEPPAKADLKTLRSSNGPAHAKALTSTRLSTILNNPTISDQLRSEAQNKLDSITNTPVRARSLLATLNNPRVSEEVKEKTRKELAKMDLTFGNANASDPKVNPGSLTLSPETAQSFRATLANRAASKKVKDRIRRQLAGMDPAFTFATVEAAGDLLAGPGEVKLKENVEGRSGGTEDTPLQGKHGQDKREREKRS